MDILKLLKELSEAPGAPGNEGEVRAIIQSHITDLVDGIDSDDMGNLYTWRSPMRGPVVMLSAHTDEIGMMVSHIDQSGFVRIAPLGGWDPRIMPGQEVVIINGEGSKFFGVAGFPSPHFMKDKDKDSIIPAEDQFIDIGARSADDVREMGIRIGDQALFNAGFRHLRDSVLMGKAFDDRVGCALQIAVLEQLARHDLDITLAVVFTCQEEVGLRGARVAGHRVDPTVALAVEGTAAGDFPGVESHRIPVRMGNGPAFTVADRSMIAHLGLRNYMERLAREHAIPYQLKTPIFGGTDAGQIHLARGGVMAGVVAVPCRYIHTPRTVMDMNDFNHALTFLTRFVTSVGEWLKTSV